MKITATKPEIVNRYAPALLDLSKVECITGKIAYNCGRTISELDNAIKYIEKSRIMILESRAVKEEDGKTCKTVPILREDGKNEDGTVKMVPTTSPDGHPLMKYLYESEEKEKEAIQAVSEMEATPVEVNVCKIPASEIMLLKNVKDGGMLIFRLGDIIDHEK